MKRILSVFSSRFLIYALVVCLSGPYLFAYEAHGLTLSNMHVKITSTGHTATFQLYDTVSAKEFYNQLPLKLGLTNFRDAQ